MPAPVVVDVLFAIGATALEIALVVLGFPILVLVVVFLVILGTGLLLTTWHPAGVAAGLAVYVLAVIVGLVGFSWLDLALAGV